MPAARGAAKLLKKRRLLASLLSLLLGGATIGAAQADNGWKLEQSSDFMGPQVTMVSKKAIKVTSPKYGLTYIMIAPKYDVIGINDSAKTYLKMTYAEWKRQITVGFDADKSPFEPCGGEKVAGVDAARYVVASSRSHPLIPLRRLKGKKKDVPYNTEFWATSSIKVPKQFTEIFTKVALMPNSLGFPLRIVQYDEEGEKIIVFNTRSIQPAKVQESFIVPSSYKRVENEMELLMGNNQNSDLAALLSEDPRHNKDAGDSFGAARPRAAKPTAGAKWAPGETSLPVGSAAAQPTSPRPRTGRQRSGGWVPRYTEGGAKNSTQW